MVLNLPVKIDAKQSDPKWERCAPCTKLTLTRILPPKKEEIAKWDAPMDAFRIGGEASQ